MNGTSLATLRERMGESGIDSFLITHPPNIRYLTGYTGEGACAVLTRATLTVFVYRINEELARRTIRPPASVTVIEHSLSAHFTSLGRTFWGETVGYEPGSLRCSTYRQITEALDGIALKPLSGLVESLRVVKSEDELAAIGRAQKITDRVFGEVLGLLTEGVTERDIAAEVDYRSVRAGGEGPAFPTIVAFGANTSMPHWIPGSRGLANGDIILIDMGTFADGYASDMTRTVQFGRASLEMRERYRLVAEAQTAGVAAVRAKARCADAYGAALEVFASRDCGDLFLHSLGHGIGLEVHEAPAVTARSDETFLEYAAVTVEPGIYIPGWGGIRIEDIVVVTDSGTRTITTSPK